jgi:hypothetical protein
MKQLLIPSAREGPTPALQMPLAVPDRLGRSLACARDEEPILALSAAAPPPICPAAPL